MCKVSDCFLMETGYWIDKSRGIFKRNMFMPYDLTNALRESRGNKGIFTTAYRYDDEEQDKANLYGDFYLDFDSEDFELVRKDVIKAVSYLKVVFRLKDIDDRCNIFFSGGKGAHIVVPAEALGIEPDNKLNEIFKTIAIAINEFIDNKTLDMRIYDKKRLFRVPNSIHESSGLYKIPISYEEIRELSQEEIKELAKSPREIPVVKRELQREASNMYKLFIERTTKRVLSFKNIKSNGTLKYTPPCIERILEDGAMNGKRNNTIAILASFYKASGKDMKEAVDLISKWNNEKNSMPTPQSEVNKTIRSIYEREGLFGCSAIKTMDLCYDQDCKFKK